MFLFIYQQVKERNLMLQLNLFQETINMNMKVSSAADSWFCFFTWETSFADCEGSDGKCLAIRLFPCRVIELWKGFSSLFAAVFPNGLEISMISWISSFWKFICGALSKKKHFFFFFKPKNVLKLNEIHFLIKVTTRFFFLWYWVLWPPPCPLCGTKHA